MEGTVERFNTNTSEIELISAKLSIQRNGFGMCTVGSDVYIFSGFKGQAQGGSTNTVEVFNLDTETFRSGKSLPIADYGFTADVLEE